MTSILVLSFLILMAIGIPIAISLGTASGIVILLSDNIPMLNLVQKVFQSLDSFPLLAVPMFILAGVLMETSGISKRLINLVSSFVGHIKGGLAIVAVISSALFSSISGSGAATAAAIGAILIPSMIERGYNRNFAAAVPAVSGELGVIIPPSLTLVVFGATTNTSIGDLFIAGIIPGILITLSLIAFVYIVAKIKKYGQEEYVNWKDRWKAFKESVLALFMPIIIIGGIYGGLFTPTEAATVAVVYAFLVGYFIYKEFSIKQVIPMILKSANSYSIVLIVVATAGLFSWLLARNNVFDGVSDLFVSITTSPIIFLLLINVLLLIVGMFIEAVGAIVILGPLLLESALTFGIDPVHFGLIMVVNLAMGMCTPPVGVNLFISCKIANISIIDIAKGVYPLLVILWLDLIIITFIPGISLFL